MKLANCEPVAQWKSLSRLLLPILAFVSIFAFLVGYFGVVKKSAKIHGSGAFFCTPDAHVLVADVQSDLSIWSPHTALWITLGFGQFTFAGAKALDFAWDLIAGRGGQFIIAYLTYPIVRRGLLRVVAAGRPAFSIGIPMYAAVAFDKVSLATVWAIMSNDNLKNNDEAVVLELLVFGWKYLMIIPILAYILLFPTFMSLMTGYQAGLVPLVRLPNGNYMDASALQIPDLLVIDGSRIGLTDMIASTPNDSWRQAVYDYQITYNKFDLQVQDMLSDSKRLYTDPGYSIDTKCFNASNGQYDSDRCYFKATTSTSEMSPGVFETDANINSTIAVSGETWDLKDTLLFVALNGRVNRTNYVNEYYFSTGNYGFNSTYLSATSQCQPTTTYIWGFSFIMLFILTFLSGCFALVLTCICYDNYMHSATDQYEQPISMYRDILDIAEEIRRRLGTDNQDLTTKELDYKIKEDKDALELETDSLLPSRHGYLTPKHWKLKNEL